MAPAKRKAASTPAPAPARSSARLSSKKPKMTTTKPDTEEEMKQEAPTRAPRVQLPDACKERLDELTRALDFKTLGSTVDFLLPSTEGAKFIAELTKDMGFNSGRQTIDWLLEMVRAKQSPDFENARRQLDWLLPNQTGRLQELTRELGFDRGGQTVDWILPMASKDFLNLTHLLGFQKSTNTIEWLLHQAKPAIAATIGRYSGTYSSPSAPPFLTPQFSQNREGLRSSTFTPAAGLGGGTTPTPTPTGGLGGGTTWYYSIPHSPTPVQSSTGPVTANPNTYFNGFSGGQSQMNGYGQYQRGYMWNNDMFNSAKMMQPMSRPRSEISTLEDIKSQQASVEDIKSHNRVGGRLKRENIQSRNKVGGRLKRRGQAENNRAAYTGDIVRPGVSTPVQHSINNHPNLNAAGDRGIRMDQLQAPPQVNHLLSQGSNSLHELGGSSKAQNHSWAMQMPVQNVGTASNDANQMSSWIPNPNPAQDIIKQIQAPADITMEGHDAIDIKDIEPRELREKPMDEFVDTEIETQTKKKQEVNEFVNIEIEPETKKQQDAISEVEGHKDGGGNQGLLEEAEATGGHVGDTNIVEVDAVDVKDTNQES